MPSTAELLERVSKNGIRVDLPNLLREVSRLKEKEAGLLDELNELTNFPALRRVRPDAFTFKKNETPRFNPRSKKHINAWLENEGEDPLNSVSIEALETKLPEDIYETIVSARRTRKYWGDLETLRKHVSLDEKIHVTWVPATTGRWYTGAPPIQTLSAICRRFLVPDKGFSLYILDWAQQELRILAQVTKEPFLVDLFELGADPHMGAFKAATGIAISDDPVMRGQQRDLGKLFNYALIYGLDARGLAVRLRVPIDHAKTLIESYFERMPVLVAWRETAKQFARENGYVTTIAGRRIDIPQDSSDSDEKLARKAVNYTIQGSGADQLEAALEEIHRIGLIDYVRATIHDAFLIETPKTEDGGRVLWEIRQAMSRDWNGLHAPVEVKGPTSDWLSAMEMVDSVEQFEVPEQDVTELLPTPQEPT